MERHPAAAAGVSFHWLEEEGPHGDSFVGTRGRVFDVIVLGRPTTSATGPRRATLEAALFDSGRPVLFAPPDPPARFGEVVTVAWNKSAETARTVAFALPLLHRAKRTVILAMEGGRVSGPSGEDLARYLERNGIATEVVRIDKSPGRGTGVAILEKAAEIGSDLLVKGAFTQSPISQLIFGGATREILGEANLPVFMAH
jgi:nucleotide-binding universal stress UspA family protein